MSGWARGLLFFFGVILLLPGACSAAFLVMNPSIVTSDVGIIWFSGAVVGAVGAFLLIKGIRG